MPFEQDRGRQRSASDPTGSTRAGIGPGKQTLTGALPLVRPTSVPPGTSGPRAQPAPQDVPLPDSPVASRPASRASSTGDLTRPASPSQVPLPPDSASELGSPRGSLHEDDARSLHHGSLHEDAASLQGGSLHEDAASLHEDAASLHEDAASLHEDAASLHAPPEVAIDIEPPTGLPPAPAVTGTATGGAQRADYYKSVSYLTAALGTLVSAIGWILLRKVPLMQPVGQALASGLKNGFGALDDAAKGNTKKAIGQTISVVGQGVAMSGVIAANHHPDSTRLPAVRATGAALNGGGMVMTGMGEQAGGNPAKAASNFVAAALNLAGFVGYTIEASAPLKTPFLALEGVNNFNNSATPIGGAIDDGRKSKKALPGLTDPKVVGQEITDLGFALSAIAGTLNKVSSESDQPEQYTQVIQALGAVGMFLATFGYAVSAWAEWPAKPKASTDVELGTTGASAAPPAP